MGSNWLNPSVANPDPKMVIVPPPYPISVGEIEVTTASPKANPRNRLKAIISPR